MKKNNIPLLVSALLILSACVSNGSGSIPQTETLATLPPEYAGMTNPLGADAASAGAEVFKKNCTACHGDKGYGDGPAGMSLEPHPKNLAEFAPTVADDYLFWRINTGRPGTAMVAWKGVLTDQQIWQVIAFIRTLK
jgi:mono/diheme cytochrome c family protein